MLFETIFASNILEEHSIQTFDDKRTNKKLIEHSRTKQNQSERSQKNKHSKNRALFNDNKKNCKRRKKFENSF